MVKLNRDFLDKHSIKAAIFDMDGLLIDSEPIWMKAEMAVCDSIGIPLTPETRMETTGMRMDEAINHWIRKNPEKEIPKEDFIKKIAEIVIADIREAGQPLPGVKKTIDFFLSHRLPIAVASSSPLSVINAVLQRLGIRDHMNFIHSADNEEFGKPHPGVFIGAAKRLDVRQANCLVFEDSINGMIAAKAARMKCIGVPAARDRNNPQISIADFIVDSLEDLH